jgi:hypothetical protein
MPKVARRPAKSTYLIDNLDVKEWTAGLPAVSGCPLGRTGRGRSQRTTSSTWVEIIIEPELPRTPTW